MPVCVYTTHHTRANLKDSEDYSQTPSTTLWFAVVYPRVSLKTLKGRSVLFISISNKYTIYKSLQGLQGHHGHIHTQKQIASEDFLGKGLQRSSGSSRKYRQRI